MHISNHGDFDCDQELIKSHRESLISTLQAFKTETMVEELHNLPLDWIAPHS